MSIAIIPDLRYPLRATDLNNNKQIVTSRDQRQLIKENTINNK